MPARIHEIARRLGVESRVVLQRAYNLKIKVASASNVVSDRDKERILESFGDMGDRIEVPARPIESSWRAGAIKPPADAALQASIDSLCTAFPMMGAHRRILRQLGSEIVHAGYAKSKKYSEYGVSLVRFSSAIESAFGLTREVVFLYSPHADTQIRAYHAAREAIKLVPREVTPDIAFIWSTDDRLKSKLDDWSNDGFMAIPLVANVEEDPIGFISLLRDYIFSRDLFYETTPVQGDRFFGRKTLLQGIRDDVLRGRVAGIYGLRKAGKTSVLTQLRSNLDSPENVVILQDLESLPSVPDDPIPQLLQDLSRAIAAKLRDLGLPTKHISDLQKFDIANFKGALTRTLRELSKRNSRLIILLDEIEYLTPSDRIDIREGSMPGIAQFLGLLRSVVQENSNFTFLLSGLTSAITESGRLYGRPNPLFAWAKSYYLSPLAQSDADSMADRTGARMGVRIEEGAMRALYDATGGHAFLYRHLASHAIQQLPINVFERRLRNADVLRSLESWRGQISGVVNEMVDHVRRYYPNESLLLDILGEDPAYFAELAREDPGGVGHLKDLGLISGDLRNGFELSPPLGLA